ncbi:hypothetical protein CYMTET_26926, partial [Cymbomonas tetramitiformis]
SAVESTDAATTDAEGGKKEKKKKKKSSFFSFGKSKKKKGLEADLEEGEIAVAPAPPPAEVDSPIPPVAPVAPEERSGKMAEETASEDGSEVGQRRAPEGGESPRRGQPPPSEAPIPEDEEVLRMSGGLAAKAPGSRYWKIKQIFEQFDRDHDGRLRHVEVVSLMMAADGTRKLTKEGGAVVVNEMFDSLRDLLDSQARLPIMGLVQWYDSGYADVDKHFDAIGLQLPDSVIREQQAKAAAAEFRRETDPPSDLSENEREEFTDMYPCASLEDRLYVVSRHAHEPELFYETTKEVKPLMMEQLTSQLERFGIDPKATTLSNGDYAKAMKQLRTRREAQMRRMTPERRRQIEMERRCLLAHLQESAVEHGGGRACGEAHKAPQASSSAARQSAELPASERVRELSRTPPDSPDSSGRPPAPTSGHPVRNAKLAKEEARRRGRGYDDDDDDDEDDDEFSMGDTNARRPTGAGGGRASAERGQPGRLSAPSTRRSASVLDDDFDESDEEQTPQPAAGRRPKNAEKDKMTFSLDESDDDEFRDAMHKETSSRTPEPDSDDSPDIKAFSPVGGGKGGWGSSLTRNEDDHRYSQRDSVVIESVQSMKPSDIQSSSEKEDLRASVTTPKNKVSEATWDSDSSPRPTTIKSFAGSAASKASRESNDDIIQDFLTDESPSSVRPKSKNRLSTEEDDMVEEELSSMEFDNGITSFSRPTAGAPPTRDSGSISSFSRPTAGAPPTRASAGAPPTRTSAGSFAPPLGASPSADFSDVEEIEI